MENKNSPVWLIILLCGLVILLFWLVTSAKNQQVVNSLNQEIENLNQQLETLQKEKEALPKNSPIIFSLPSSTPSATPLISPKPKISTSSGVRR